MSDGKKKRHRRRTPEEFKEFGSFLSLHHDLERVLKLMLHIDDTLLRTATNKIKRGKAYKSFAFSKGKGKGKRQVDAPCGELKEIQRRILNFFLMGIPVHFCRHNVRGSSIYTNAKFHERAGLSHVLTIDLINAFPSVKRDRVEAVLFGQLMRRLREFGRSFSDDEKRILLNALVDLVVYKGRLPIRTQRLPQGPPTSPRILDIACYTLDQAIFQYLEQKSTPDSDFRFTVYVDDLTISSKHPIAEDVRRDVVEIIREHGFVAHSREDKCEYFSPDTGKVPVVTGIALHPDRLMLTPRKARQFEGTLHQLLKKKHWDTSDRGVVAGILGHIGQLGEESIPSRMKDIVRAARIRLAAHSSALHSVQAEKTAKGSMTRREAKKLLHDRAKTEGERACHSAGLDPEHLSAKKKSSA